MSNYNYARIYNDGDKGNVIRKFDVTSYYDAKQILKDIIEFNKLDKEEFIKLFMETIKENFDDRSN
jgi:hypothetical protein